MYVCFYVYISDYFVCMGAHEGQKREDIGSPTVEDRGNCESPDAGAGYQTSVL